MRSITRILLIQVLAATVAMEMFAGTATHAQQQDQRVAAAKELEPLVLDFYATKVREQITASAPGPYVSLTVATKRYDTSYAVVSFSLDTTAYEVSYRLVATVRLTYGPGDTIPHMQLYLFR